MRSRLSAPVLLGVALGLLPIRPLAVQARNFNVPCDDQALRAVLGAVETNGEEDIVWLAKACTYALGWPWVVEPDGGFPQGFAVTVHGRGATLSGGKEHPVLVVSPTAVLSLEEVTVRDGRSTGDGGAIQNLGVLSVTDSTVADSEAQTGGGVVNYENGRLTLVRSTVAGNRAEDLGAGIRNRGGRLTLVDSTLSGNTATGVAASGGGAMAVHDSTLTHNQVPEGGNGGGLYVRAGSLKLAHSIVANSVFEANGDECVVEATGTILPTRANLVEDGSCALAGALSGDPLLGAPTGAPAHYPLQPGSPAIDASDDTQYCAAVDQRGEPLRDGDRDGLIRCDLGSYEAP